MRSHIRISGKLWRVSALTMFLLALAAPASAQEAPKPEGGTPLRQTINLKVENNNYLDMHVYAVQDGFLRSLGVVTGLSTEELTIPETVVASGAHFQLFVDPIGSEVSYLTDPIILGGGKEIDLMVQSDLEMSSYSIKR